MKVLILGSRGMVGSSISRMFKQLKTYEVINSSRADTNLFSLEQTKRLIEEHTPDIIINSAATVGGIVANNSFRTEFIINNLKINLNLFESVLNYPNINIINLGSSCIYPLDASNPIKESSLMTGKLEPTNSPYAMAKLTSIEMGESVSIQYGHNVLNLMPTNLYGPNDNFDFEKSHVIPGLIARMHKAKIDKEDKFSVWGTGKPLREFLYVDDLALAIIHLIENNVKSGIYNIGSGEEIDIANLVNQLKEVINYKGKILFDDSKPDGNPRKLLDSSKIFSLGWKPKINLKTGLKETYSWFLTNQ